MQTKREMEEKAWQKLLLNTEMEKIYQMKQENLSENISFIGGGFRMTLPKCMLCSNFNENSEEMTCKAFPDGIPEDVIFSGYEEECKNGIKFKEFE